MSQKANRHSVQISEEIYQKIIELQSLKLIRLGEFYPVEKIIELAIKMELVYERGIA